MYYNNRYVCCEKLDNSMDYMYEPFTEEEAMQFLSQIDEIYQQLLEEQKELMI